MNYYPFHIGDYASATQHLSWDEDAAYRRLLDAYYVREEPLPLELRSLFRLVRAQSAEQREATETVLREFFIETAEGWRHGRCDAEIAAMNEKREKASQSAHAKWAKERAANAAKTDANATGADANASSAACEGNAPNTNTNTNTNTRRKPLRGSRTVPDDFTVTDELRAWAASNVVGVDIDNETAKFRDCEFRDAKTDWPKAWRMWMRRAADGPSPRAAGPPTSKQSALEARNAETARKLWDGAI